MRIQRGFEGRRRFLRLMALAAAGYMFPGTACGRNPLGERGTRSARTGRKVIVVGAGASGLAAAESLASAGHAVLVLEARDRIGGRIHSDASLGAVVDMGASWIHGRSGNPLTELATRFSVPTFESDLADWIVYDVDGTVIPEAEVARMERWIERAAERAAHIAEAADEDMSYLRAFQAATAGSRLSEREWRLLENYLTGLEVESGADLERFSSWYGEDDEIYPGPDLLFPRGYVEILEGLAGGKDVRLGAVVERIEHTDRGVVVIASGERHEADAAVVTLPLGVLKRGTVEFAPGLSPAREAAIGRLGMGVLNKAALRFPRVFWPEETQYFEYASGPRDQGAIPARMCGTCHTPPEPRASAVFTEFCNMVPVQGTPILVAFSGGPFGHRLESWSDHEVVAEVMPVLRTMFGKEIPSPDAVSVSRWHQDPYAGGAYPHVPVGASMEDFDVLASPEGTRLFFAGDATSSTYPSTVHGAVLSGRRAAGEVLEALAGARPQST